MRFTEVGLPGAYIVDLDPIPDSRGFFARTWCAREFEERGLEGRVAQCNLSYSRSAGTLRGMHFQLPPHEETKLVRCIRGAILDVIVDLRPQSPTHARWLGVELTSENRRALYVPRGFAHGFQTLDDHTEVVYQHSEFFAPGFESGVRWDDPAFGIVWPPAGERVISERDRSWRDYAP